MVVIVSNLFIIKVDRSLMSLYGILSGFIITNTQSKQDRSLETSGIWQSYLTSYHARGV